MSAPLLAILLAAALGGCEEADQRKAEVGQISPLQPSPTATEEETYVTRGIVKSVDTERSRITIDHAAVPDLKWPPMTMQFEVTETELIKDIKVDDAVRFNFMESGRGTYVVQDLVRE